MAYPVQDFTTIPNAESYLFSPISAFQSYCIEKLSSKSDSGLDELPEGLPSKVGCETPELRNFLSLQMNFLDLNSGFILNSCREIEGTYIDLLAKLDINKNKHMWAIVPLDVGKKHGEENSKVRHKCLIWLDKQAPNSVIYVSFGTTVSMRGEEIKELALGLEQSGQMFIWVLRDADKGNALDQRDVKLFDLPRGYEERVQHIGMVVREWVPQSEILGHPSTGGFMSHCGWNSCLESITMGVPMACWPMHSDQPTNAFFVTDVLKIGIAVIKSENRNDLVTSTIAKVVKCLIALKEGGEIRKRAKELGTTVREAVEDGGDSVLELNSFISHITK